MMCGSVCVEHIKKNVFVRLLLILLAFSIGLQNTLVCLHVLIAVFMIPYFVKGKNTSILL